MAIVPTGTVAALFVLAIEIRRYVPMTTAAKKSRAKYMRDWRKKNPGKQKLYTEKMWERKAEQERLAKAEREAAGTCV